MLHIAVNKGTKVYKVPVFKAVVVFRASNMQIKNIEKNKLMIKLRGNALTMPCLYFDLSNTIGNNTNEAIRKRSNVNEKGFITPANFLDEMKEPATNKVTNIASK